MVNIMKSRKRAAVEVRRQFSLKPHHHGRSAFTLVELLVVIGILAILAMIMYPSLGNVFGVARSTQCTSRLKEIGKAVRLAEAQEGREKIQALMWQTLLTKYLGGDKSAMICPEHTYIMTVLYNDEEEEELPMPLKDLVQFKVVKGGQTFYEDLDKGPMVVKISPTNYALAKSHPNHYFGNANSANNLPRANYEDGSENTCNPYWLCLEDFGGDWDYKDVMVKVTITSTGYLLECESGFTGHQNSIMDKLTGEQIQRIYSNSPAGTLEPVPVTTAGVIASYGMNTAVPDVLDTPGAVMVLDYHWMMAAPNDIWSDYPNPFNSGVPSFARHSGRINTVFVDGSVRSMDPYDLDPKNSHVERTYWLP